MEIATQKIEVSPWFDLELFLNLSQETRLGGETLDRLQESWNNWSNTLQVHEIKTSDKSYLLVALAEEVGDEIDATWEKSPSLAFQYNALAQTMCMSVIHDLIPQIEDAGCAPAPKPTLELQTALKQLKMGYQPETCTLQARYAVLTPYPFKGGCEICALQAACPKGKDKGHTVVLPGYENPFA